MLAAAALPDRHAIREVETERVLGRLLRWRPYLLPVLAVVVLALVLLDPTRERLLAWGLFAVPVASLVAFDRWRLARGLFRPAHVPYDLAGVIFMQGVLISLTGLVDSPLLPVLVVMSTVSGVAQGVSRAHVALVLFISALVWTLFAVELHGWWPSVAALLDPPPLDVGRSAWRALGAQLLILVAGFGGTVVHATMMHGIDAAIDAREGLLRSLASRNEELTSLSGALAHELKNPLASIHGLVTLIERSDDNRARRFEVLRREVDRMKRTVDELLDFARAAPPAGQGAGQGTGQRAGEGSGRGPSSGSALVVPGALLAAVTAERAAAAEARGVSIAPPPIEDAAALWADERKLHRALANLLDNAIEASSAGTTVEWIARVAGDRWELGVADRGPGLPDGAGRLGFTTKPEGSGLGLAMSRTVAEQHGGALVVRAREGGGAEVVLVLPRGPAAETGERAATAATAEAAGARPPGEATHP